MKNNNTTHGFFSMNLTKLAAVLALGLIVAFTGGQSFAASQTGGFTGPGPELVTVKQALEMPDDAGVTLKGNIARNLGDETYEFRDATGAIEVEIDHEIWQGRNVSPDDVVVITGEIDKDWGHVEVEVSSLEVQRAEKQ